MQAQPRCGKYGHWAKECPEKGTSKDKYAAKNSFAIGYTFVATAQCLMNTASDIKDGTVESGGGKRW